MKLPDPEQFNFKDCVIAGDECWLITPNSMSTEWTDDNARFRSCIVRKCDNFVVSQGFLKFCNFGEKPDFQPWDSSWKIEARHKLDDSLLIVSKYKGELIIRTRGTIDARQLPNGHEIDLLIEKYPNVFQSGFWDLLQKETHPTTLLFAWTTPSNIIVIREHDEPTLTLIGAIDNRTGKYWLQDELDEFAELTLKIGRPQKYLYDSVEECIMDVKAWSGKEGVVLYSPDGQTLKKIKADEYCELHKLATGIKGVNQVLDVFMASPKFEHADDFYRYIENTLDFEIAEKCKDFISQICDAYSKYLRGIHKIKNEIEKYIRPLETRKDQAVAIQREFHGWMTPLAFSLLDNKEIDDKMIQKSLEKILEL